MGITVCIGLCWGLDVVGYIQEEKLSLRTVVQYIAYPYPHIIALEGIHTCTYYCTSGLMNRDRRKVCECLSLAAFHLNKGDVVLGIVITLLHVR